MRKILPIKNNIEKEKTISIENVQKIQQNFIGDITCTPANHALNLKEVAF